MTKNRTLTWIAAAFLVACMAAPAMADERACYDDCIANGGDRDSCAERCFTDDGDDDRGDDRSDDPMARVVEWLELTEEQIGEWNLILETMRETLQPLLEQYRELDAELGEAMRAEDPDRELIGELTLALRDLGAEIKTVHTQAIADMIDVLVPVQVEKLASRALAGLFANNRGGDRGGVRHGSRERVGGGGGDRP